MDFQQHSARCVRRIPGVYSRTICWHRCWWPAQVALFVMVEAAVGFADGPAKEFTPHGTVVDLNRKPVPRAQITLHRWDDVMSPALQTTTTDVDGRFRFQSRRDGSYYYVVVRKAPYAPIGQIIGDEGPIEATLRPAVDAWIEVRNAEGAPLAGGRLASISIRTSENTEMYVCRGMEHLFGFEFTPSDNAGRLNLPELPEGALVDVLIDHPRWAQVKLSSARVAKGRLDALSMPAGVMTTFEFVADSRTPMALEGVTCELSLLAQSHSSAESVNQIPMRIAGNRVQFCAHPVTYSLCSLSSPGLVITPSFQRLTIERDAEMNVRFLVRKPANASGRVMNADGTPHKGAEVVAQVENLSPDGGIPGVSEWAYSGRAQTDDRGRFTVALAPGRCRIQVNSEGTVMDRDAIEFVVRTDGANEVPDFVAKPLQPVRGKIVDEHNRPVPGAIVRIRHPSMLPRQPEVSDADGKYEIAIPRIPADPDTRQRCYHVDVAAFATDQRLMGVTQIDLRRDESLSGANIVLQPDPSPDALISMVDNRWVFTKMQQVGNEREPNSYPAGQRGQPAPELDGIAWFNTDARSLKDFHGRYVLLDFWFTGCEACHYDFPSVKLVHERFESHDVTVIGVHDNSSTPQAIREHCRQQGLKFPIVVDHPDGRILNAYRKLGVTSAPGYILIGPDGNILQNDAARDGPPLRAFKLEVIRKYVLQRQN